MSKTVRYIVLIIIVVALAYYFWPASYGPGVDEAGALNTDVISRQVSNGDAILLDVRTTQELAVDGYAEGSTHFDLARLQGGELPEYNPDTTIYVYCKAGGRAGTAEGILEGAGYTDVTNIGGLVDWEEAGGAVVQ